MYVCGHDRLRLLPSRATPRMLLVFDVVTRYLRHRGYRLTYVRNITDIDDKIIARARENGEPIEAVTERFINRDARGLRGARDSAARSGAPRHRVRGANARSHLRPRGQGLCLPRRRRRRLLRDCALSGVREAVGQPGGSASSRSADRRGRDQGIGGGLRAVEGGEAGRALLAVALGSGPAGLAYRVLRDVDGESRRTVRHPRRGPRPRLSPS